MEGLWYFRRGRYSFQNFLGEGSVVSNEFEAHKIPSCSVENAGRLVGITADWRGSVPRAHVAFRHGECKVHMYSCNSRR